MPEYYRKLLYKFLHPGHYEKVRKAYNPSDKGDFSLRPFDEKQCIFVHVPKAAGTSIALSLFGKLPYHYTVTDYKVIFGRRDFQRYFKFAFVRNPWDRLFSAFTFLKKGGWDDKDREWASQHLEKYDNFEQFVMKCDFNEEIMSFMHFRPQFEFVCSQRKTIELNYLGYFETINDDYSKICKRLNLPDTLEHRNASTKSSYRDQYSEPMISRVETLYADDIRLFGYCFEGIKSRVDLEKEK